MADDVAQHPEAAGAAVSCWKCGGTGEVKGKRGVRKSCVICCARKKKDGRHNDGDDEDDESTRARRRAVHVVVVGAGIGGCAIGLALGRLGFSVTILEKDESFAQRKQGYGLTIQQGWGALRRLGLEPPKMETPSYSHFAFGSDGRILGYFGSSFSEWFASQQDYSAKRNGKFNGQGRFNSHVPRQHLRSMLLEPLSDVGVKVLWNSKFDRLQTRSDSTEKAVDVVFHGKFETTPLPNLRELDEESSMSGQPCFAIAADLVVAADGIFSGVRRAIYGAEDHLNYLGCVVVLGIAALRHPLTHERVCETMDGETRLYTMPFTSAHDDSFQTDTRLRGQDSIMWQLSFPMQDEDEAKALCADKTYLMSEALRRCGTWHAPIPTLLQQTDLELLSGHPVYDRPELDAADLNAHLGNTNMLGKLAFVGDAAHPMSPFKGQGANQALVDAAALASELCAGDNSTIDVPAAVERYHLAMCKRTASKVRGSRAAVALLHEPVPDPEALADLWDAGVSASSPDALNDAIVAIRGFGHCPHALHSVKIEASKIQDNKSQS
ncbi:Hypothetical Protein FCC1311_023672 [Hondaea fermentalgiana]|uniref:FAD-binding domain-containing protein n=1 Tax=Hondaea fermentalgiana TaxID=2315210 RepID=A0A2R5G538_9STRA|nr:Hypothetical Protein FCC1311_023672 [Hondaea fermentalgiana]|eukprot:GBG26147.1 Hypothetical Protein FCC1311_023672 [Hondaea fermentalgiana]